MLNFTFYFLVLLDRDRQKKMLDSTSLLAVTGRLLDKFATDFRINKVTRTRAVKIEDASEVFDVRR